MDKAFPACCECSEERRENRESDTRVLKRLVVTLLAEVTLYKLTLRSAFSYSTQKTRPQTHTHTALTYVTYVRGPVRCADSRVGDVLVAGLHCSISAGLLEEKSGSLFQLLLTGQHPLCAEGECEKHTSDIRNETLTHSCLQVHICTHLLSRGT